MEKVDFPYFPGFSGDMKHRLNLLSTTVQVVIKFVGVKQPFKTHGNGGFYGFPGYMTLRLDLCPTRAQALIQFISVKKLFTTQGKGRFYGFCGDVHESYVSHSRHK